MRSVVQSVTDVVNKAADAVENLSNAYATSGLSGVVAEVNKMLSGTSDGVKNVGAAIAGIGAVVGANAFFSSGTWSAVSKGIDVVNGGFGVLVSSVASSAKGFKKSASSFLPFEVNIRKSIASMRSDFRQSLKMDFIIRRSNFTVFTGGFYHDSLQQAETLNPHWME